MADAPYTAQDTWHDPDGSIGTGPLDLQSDGDVLTYSSTYRNDASLKKGTLAKLLDMVNYLYNRSSQGTFTLGTGKHVNLASRSVTRSAGAVSFNENGLAIFGAAGSVAATTGFRQIQLDLPHGAVLTKCSFGVNPVNGTPPAGTSVSGAIYRTAIAAPSGGSTLLVSTEDPTSGAGYGADHSFDTATISSTVDRTLYTYHALFSGESGAGADAAVFGGCTWTCTITGIDDGVA